MFEKSLRVYYEDTDAGGIVYHSNYLNFMERCRCDWLESLGFNVADLAEQEKLAFVVKEANLIYHHPAKLFDQLRVVAEVLQVGKVKLEIRQEVYNRDMLLCSGVLKMAVIDAQTSQIKVMPESLRTAMKQSLNTQ